MLQRQSYLFLSVVLLTVLFAHPLQSEVKTWDGQHSIEKIALRVVYFVPQDRPPLNDWHDRANYFCKRIEQFHEREYGGQSQLVATLEMSPFVSQLTTEQLREGDGDSIFFKTLREVDTRLDFGKDDSAEFPILLVLSEINWRPLDDFYRLQPTAEGFKFEGNFTKQQHFPGAASGGARATYLARQRKGWGLVSADGWRVPYRGSDCVVYHEGVGHTVGLPHPQPGNNSVMSLGQYNGWISESWLDKEQKIKMNWNPELPVPQTPQIQLFSEFRAVQSPLIPKPLEAVALQFDWPEGSRVKNCVVEIQTELGGPWVEVAGSIRNAEAEEIKTISLGTFDRATPVSYRVHAELVNGSTAELWGYFQVRQNEREPPVPWSPSIDLQPDSTQESTGNVRAGVVGSEVNVMELLDVEAAWKQGDWTKDEQGRLVSPKAFGARLELPVEVPRNYRMIVVAEPLDPPNGLLLGSRLDTSRFATLINYTPGEVGLSALENVDGQNVGNVTTYKQNLLQQGRLSQIVITVQGENVRVVVDGDKIIDWTGSADRLSLGDYWKTPNSASLFLGAYDCRYRFHRVTLAEIE